MAIDADRAAPHFDIDITDLTDKFEDQVQELLRAAAISAFHAEAATQDWEVSVVLTDDPHLQALHFEFLDDDSPTDIMTFPLDSEVNGQARSGEIVISVDRAVEQAQAARWTVSEELTFLVVHGVLHLLDWDDRSPAERDAMLARQREILSRISA